MRDFIHRNIVLALGFSALLYVSGCSLPQVVVLEDPLSAQESLQLGLAYESRGQLELAEERYRKAADQDIPEAFLFLGNIAYRKQAYRHAETLYQKAMERMPEDPRAYNNLAWMLYEQGKLLNTAEALARKAVALAKPDSRDDYLDTLGKILAAGGSKQLEAP
jgi:Tfp pilus assembly protein PilF